MLRSVLTSAVVVSKTEMLVRLTVWLKGNASPNH